MTNAQHYVILALPLFAALGAWIALLILTSRSAATVVSLTFEERCRLATERVREITNHMAGLAEPTRRASEAFADFAKAFARMNEPKP